MFSRLSSPVLFAAVMVVATVSWSAPDGALRNLATIVDPARRFKPKCPHSREDLPPARGPGPGSPAPRPRHRVPRLPPRAPAHGLRAAIDVTT